ncbi:MAG: GHKL domain-containing protein [Lachnospiraceae bacterium]|nr:GHKL domain-containing protein [Lachnospiraceae bacterium]
MIHPVNTIIMVTISIIVTKIVYNLETDVAIITTIIGYGISYIFYLLGLIFLGIIYGIIGYHPDEANLLSIVIVGVFQMTFIILLFRIKRLRYGFPFLTNSRYGDLGVYLSTAILIMASFLGEKSESQYIVVVLFSVFFICGINLWFWWKNRMVREYMEQLHQRERLELESIILSKEAEITLLKEENKTFSKIIHKDNKLIPAMELAVKETLYTVVYNENLHQRIRLTENLLMHLEAVSAERSGIISNYEHSDSKQISTGILIIDAMLTYMQQKAKEKDVSLEIDFDETINELIPKIISQEDATTLLADLLENAIIAAGENSQNRCVHLEIVKKDIKSPCIFISDTGEPFPEEVKNNWGIQRITTHAADGGSGIGMMSIYEICKRYHASFFVEAIGSESIYTKHVAVYFDGEDRYLFNTKL